jgi:hypothetical protein
MTPLPGRSQLVEQSAVSVPEDIPEIRNRLSHRAEDYSWQAVRRAMRAMSAIGSAHVLRLLDLPLDCLPIVLDKID